MQRPVKFAKYLKKFGWEPIVVAPEPDIYHTFDDSLTKELQKASVRVERVKNSKLLKAGKKSLNPSYQKPWKVSLLKWLTSWFFLPDNKKGWIDSAVACSIEIIRSESISAVFSTAPPYSNLIAAKKIKEETGLPVIMDLRDDWLESHLIHYPTRWHYKKMKQLEFSTLTSADHITVVNSYYRSKIQNRLGEMCPEISVIPNGFDKENFEAANSETDSSVFTILYSGIFYGSRKPDWFLKSVKKVMDINSDFKNHIQLKFQGGLNDNHWKTIEKLGLTKYVADLGYLGHQEAVQNVVNADVLWLTLGERKYNDAVTPGKVFEYMGSLKPILAFIPDGETRTLLDNYGASRYVDITDSDSGAEAIETFYDQWKKGELPVGNQNFVQSFERAYLTEQLAAILSKLTEENRAEADKRSI